MPRALLVVSLPQVPQPTPYMNLSSHPYILHVQLIFLNLITRIIFGEKYGYYPKF
jgi:hypothetical protein